MPQWVRPPLPTRWNRSGQPPFVGRRREFAALEEIWAHVPTGAGAAVFVGGEAGAGKSRLVAEFATATYSAGAAVLIGSCTAELGGAYDPFDEPIAHLADAAERDELSDPAGVVDWESLRARLGDIVGTGGAPTAALAQRQLCQAVVTAARAASMTHPLVLVLEDVQWAGATALRLLTYLIERTADASVLLLITLRTRTSVRSSDLTETLAGLNRLDSVLRIELPPLSEDDVIDYVELSEKVPPTRVARTAAELRQLSGGNAFYLRELFRTVQAQPEGVRRAPESLRDALDTVLARLTPRQTGVLELAAVLGQEFSSVELATICEVDAGISADAVDEALAAAEKEGLLFDGASRFSHGIARQVLLDRIAPNRLAVLHGLIAEQLESTFPGASRLIPRLAHHYASAGTPRHAASAVRYLTAAAQLAERSLAHREASVLLRRAATLETDGTQRAELLLRAARSCTLGGDFDAARVIDEDVAVTGDPHQRVRAAIGYEVVSWRPGLPGHRAVDLLSETIGGIPDDPTDPVYVRALAALARATAFTGRRTEAAPISDRAVEMARGIGDPRLLASVLRTSIHHTLRPQGLLSRLGRADELSALSRESGNAEVLGSAAIIRGAAHFVGGHASGVGEAERDLARVAQRMGGGEWDYWLGSIQYGLAFTGGRLEEASRICRDLHDRQEEFGSDRTDGPFGLQSYMVRREAGDLRKVRRLISGDESPHTQWAPGLLALYTEFHMLGPARRMLDLQLGELSSFDRESAEWPARLAFLVEGALLLRDVAAARRLRPLMAEYSGFGLMSGFFLAVFGSADRYLGALESLIGTGAPPGRFEGALALDERVGDRLRQAETLALHAVHLRCAGRDVAAARSMEARSRAIAESDGLARVLRILGGPKPDRATRLSDGLTSRELDVLKLVGEGLGNRDVAARLVISENTAANHIRSILLKIGAANRTQAAIYASERGLLDRSEVRRS